MEDVKDLILELNKIVKNKLKNKQSEKNDEIKRRKGSKGDKSTKSGKDEEM